MRENVRVRYRWTDAWLLAAIALASRNKAAQLWQIIASGDDLNHTIFTPEEIESGLVRLTREGWITECAGQFSTTDLFKRENLKIRNWDSVRKIEKLLDAEPRNENELMPHPANNLKYPGITSEVLNGALKVYEKNARVELNRLLGKSKDAK